MFKSAMLTSRGGKNVNEDSVRLSAKGDSLCAVLADGLGGHGGGDLASACAADTIIRMYDTQNIRNSTQLSAAIAKANEAVFQKQTKQCEMKTTVAALRLEQDTMFWAHVGDSRLYHFCGGKIQSHTRDHSASQLAVLMGDIDESEIRFHSQRARILRALGAVNAQPDVHKEEKLCPGETVFLLCSDGFWEYVLESEMESTLAQSRQPEAWLKLMEEILTRKVKPGNDNYSAIAVFA